MTKVRATYKDIWRISYPIMLGSLAQTVLGLTDTAFLGRVGEVELGAAGIATVFYFVLNMIGIAVGVGLQILVARKAGEGKISEIGKIYDHSFIIFMLLAVILVSVQYAAAPFLFRSIIQSHEICQAAEAFIYYRGWGIIFMMIIASMRGFYVGIATTRIITYSAFIMTGLNVVLAYAFIFGHFGFATMGIGGAGLANAISEAVAAIYLLVYTFYKKEFKVYGLFRFQKGEYSIYKSIINLSSPIMLQNLISMGSWFLFFIFIEKMGQHQLAISNMVRSTYMIMMTPMWGFSAAANSMTSNLIGQGKSDEVMPLLKKIITLSLLISACIGLINILFPEQVLGITSSDENLIRDAMGSFYVVCGAIIIFCISLVYFSGVSGTGNTKVAMMMEIVNICIYMLYVYLCVEVLKTTVEWVWASEIIYWLLMGVMAFIYLQTNHWKKIKL